MKNLFKIGFLAFTLSLSLTSCDFFSSTPKTQVIDSNNVDSNYRDSLKHDSNLVDSGKLKVDTVKK